jgi:hypothetical protein
VPNLSVDVHDKGICLVHIMPTSTMYDRLPDPIVRSVLLSTRDIYIAILPDQALVIDATRYMMNFAGSKMET